MSPSQVLQALKAWDALTLPTTSSFDAYGLDGKRYPRERHLLAWDLEQAIDRLSPYYRGVAGDIISGHTEDGIGIQTVARMLSDELKGLVTF